MVCILSGGPHAYCKQIPVHLPELLWWAVGPSLRLEGFCLVPENIFIAMYYPGIKADDSTFCQGYAVKCGPAHWYAAFKHEPYVGVDTQRFVDYSGSARGRSQMIRDAVSDVLM